MSAIDDESADKRKRFCLHVFHQDDVDPACDVALDVCDKEVLIVTSQDSTKAIRRVVLCQVVTKLLRQARDVGGV